MMKKRSYLSPTTMMVEMEQQSLMAASGKASTEKMSTETYDWNSGTSSEGSKEQPVEDLW